MPATSTGDGDANAGHLSHKDYGATGATEKTKKYVFRKTLVRESVFF